MPTVLVTGANRGIGLEFARQYAAAGWRVIAAVRNPAKADDLQALAPAVTVRPYDAAELEAGRTLAAALDGQAVDLVIANAGVYGGKLQKLDRGIDAQSWLETLRVNTIAPIKLAEALLPNLRAGQGKTVVFITSQMGSIADNGSGAYYAYRSSKAGLNAAAKSFSVDTAADGLIAVVMHPGWVRTDMGGENAPLTPAASVAGMRKVIAGLKPRDGGKFLSYDGRTLPW